MKAAHHPILISAIAYAALLGAVVRCASNEPSDAPPSEDAGPDVPAFSEASAADGEAGVPVGNVCGSAEGLEKDAPWPMGGGCPKRAGVSTGRGPDVANIKWSFLSKAGESSPALSADGHVWVTTEDSLVALSAEGIPSASLRVGGPSGSSPARASYGFTIVGGGDGYVYAASIPLQSDGGADGGDAGEGDADAGEGAVAPADVRFRVEVGGMVSSPAIGHDGTIYVGTTAGKLLALEGNGRNVKWSFTTHDTSRSSPAIAVDGTIYIGSSDQRLYAVAPDGSRKWTFETGGAASSSPVVGGDESIYIGAVDGKLYAVTADGKARWSYATGGPITGTPAVRGGVLYVGSEDKKLHAVSTETGEGIWTFATLGAVASPVIGDDGTVYVGSADGNLYAVTPSGLLFFAVRLGGKVRAAPAIGSGQILYVTTDNAIVAIGQ